VLAVFRDVRREDTSRARTLTQHREQCFIRTMITFTRLRLVRDYFGTDELSNPAGDCMGTREVGGSHALF
jgi:hypothetical protein